MGVYFFFTHLDTLCVADEGFITGVPIMNEGKKMYARHAICAYCGRTQAKLSRHLMSRHGSEKEVLAYKNAVESKKRALLAKIRHLGYKHLNDAATKTGRGNLLVKYRPRSSKQNVKNGKTCSSAQKYEECVGCKGLYKRRYLTTHQKLCALCPTSMRGVRNARVVGDFNYPIQISTPTKVILSKLHPDEVTAFMKRDILIMKLAEKLARKGEHAAKYTCNSLRELSRFMIYYNKTSGKKSDLQALIDPLHYKSIVKAVNSMTENSAPSLAIRLGHTLRACASLVFTEEACNGGDVLIRERAILFEKVMKRNWKFDVTVKARTKLHDAKKGKVELQPSTEDIKKLSDFLKINISKYLSALRTAHALNIKDYEQLQKCLLCLIVMFNRKRAGEASKITLNDYLLAKSESNLTENAKEFELSKFEHALVENLTRVVI